MAGVNRAAARTAAEALNALLGSQPPHAERGHAFILNTRACSTTQQYNTIQKEDQITHQQTFESEDLRFDSLVWLF